MSEIKWLLEETVHAVHQRQIAEHGVRDGNLLLSALARPQNLLAYSENAPDIAALAAAYAFGIAKNHPFKIIIIVIILDKKITEFVL